jgi:hypothetical protein
VISEFTAVQEEILHLLGKGGKHRSGEAAAAGTISR